jgi:lipopolysaccharide export system protein LptC
MVLGRGYSRFVATAKIALPLTALALLATLFLIARQINPDDAIPFAEVDVEEYARQERIGAPEFSGMTADGTLITLSAETALPDPETPGRMTASSLSARIEPTDGSVIEARAVEGVVDGPDKTVELSGGVELTSSSGYRIAAPGIFARLGESEIVATGPVTAEGPPGKIEAQGMELRPSEADPDAYVMIFKGGVRLVYNPEN